MPHVTFDWNKVYWHATTVKETNLWHLRGFVKNNWTTLQEWKKVFGHLMRLWWFCPSQQMQPPTFTLIVQVHCSFHSKMASIAIKLEMYPYKDEGKKQLSFSFVLQQKSIKQKYCTFILKHFIIISGRVTTLNTAGLQLTIILNSFINKLILIENNLIWLHLYFRSYDSNKQTKCLPV